MGNIVGEGFDPIIISQINQRQKIYGSINRTNEILNYLNNKTGWCRLVSSVNVVESPPNRNLPNTGKDLAKNFILFNGVSKRSLDNIEQTYKSNLKQRGGIWPGTDDPSFNNYAYGIGGTNFGLRPMPGITQATIKTETRGSLKTATINIKANNREQFDIIDILYMRLGYTMLLEWGSSSYFDNDEKYIADNPHSLIDDFFNNKINYNNYPERINKERLDSNGNYDAIIGKVVNFNWTFTKDGTYDITVILRSMGDVIESLKTNILLPGTIKVSNNNNSSPSNNPTEVIKSFSQVHSIGKEFYRLQQELASDITSGYVNNINVIGYNPTPNRNGGTFILKARSENPTANNMAFKDKNIDPNSVIAFAQVYKKKGTQYYIRLGYFLKFLEKKIVPYVNNPEVSLIKFDTDVRSNIIYLQARQISSNPEVCIFKSTWNLSDKEIKFAPECDNFIIYKNKNRYGQIMNAYFNMTWILTTMDSLKDKDGKISLYSLLESICDGWNKSTGNFNKLEPTLDDDKTIRFIDEVALPDKEEWLRTFGQSNEDTFFDIYGYYPGAYYVGGSYSFDDNGGTGTFNRIVFPQTAGFVKDLSFNTTISPNLATMVTIGATSNGYIVGQDSTALSRMNAGLEDSFKQKIEFSEDKSSSQGSSSIVNNYKDVLKNYNEFLSQLGSVNGDRPKWNQEAIDNFTNTAETFYEYDQAKQTLQAVGLSKGLATRVISGQTTSSIQDYLNVLGKSPASSNIGFLPFNLQLTMDGLSGMKVYQKYTIDTTYLPSNYPTSLEFIIKGITNTIQNNEWTTTIESIAIPKNPFGSVFGENAVESASNRDANRGTSAGNSNAIRANSNLRQVIINAEYPENTPEYKLALAIGTKEGWNPTANNGLGSRSYRNNNPGNLDISNNFKTIDPNVTLENNPYGKNRFAHFTTAELGVKALIELKIKRWANGDMPITEGNQALISNRQGGPKYKAKTPPTLAQFVYTFAPPNENDTEKYISDLIQELTKIKKDITRTTLVKNLFA